MAPKDRTMMNRKKYQEDEFHLNRKKNIVTVEIV